MRPPTSKIPYLNGVTRKRTESQGMILVWEQYCLAVRSRDGFVDCITSALEVSQLVFVFRHRAKTEFHSQVYIFKLYSNCFSELTDVFEVYVEDSLERKLETILRI